MIEENRNLNQDEMNRPDMELCAEGDEKKEKCPTLRHKWYMHSSFQYFGDLWSEWRCSVCGLAGWKQNQLPCSRAKYEQALKQYESMGKH